MNNSRKQQFILSLGCEDFLGKRGEEEKEEKHELLFVSHDLCVLDL